MSNEQRMEKNCRALRKKLKDLLLIIISTVRSGGGFSIIPGCL